MTITFDSIYKCRYSAYDAKVKKGEVVNFFRNFFNSVPMEYRISKGRLRKLIAKCALNCEGKCNINMTCKGLNYTEKDYGGEHLHPNHNMEGLEAEYFQIKKIETPIFSIVNSDVYVTADFERTGIHTLDISVEICPNMWSNGVWMGTYTIQIIVLSEAVNVSVEKRNGGPIKINWN